jgi:hypothetical protein
LASPISKSPASKESTYIFDSAPPYLKYVFSTIRIGGTKMFPPLVMEMQTGSTNKHISQIFIVLAAPMYWWEMVNCRAL